MNIGRPIEPYGKNSTRVLEDLMGLPTTSTDEVAEALSTVYKLIAKKRIIEAQEHIALLRSKGFNDPELRRAILLIQRQNLIGK